MKKLLHAGFIALLALPMVALAQAMPDAESAEFCQTVQQILANTSKVSENTIFTDMPSYRASKPAADPLQTYQVVSYSGTTPIMVSCKVKAADHIRITYGESAAGEQLGCPVVEAMLQEQAALQLDAAGNAEAANTLRGFVLEQNEPYVKGSSYLSDFQLSFVGDDGAVHISSPGLHVDYDSWWSYIMPERFIGQTYCHLATTDYLKALATGAMQPGIVMTTVADAQVTPAE
jgi:hypothetical protein